MKIKITIYVLIDCHGNKDWACVKDNSYNIACIGGIGKDGDYHQYNSYEGYYLDSWAKQHGMTVETYTKEINI